MVLPSIFKLLVKLPDPTCEPKTVDCWLCPPKEIFEPDVFSRIGRSCCELILWDLRAKLPRLLPLTAKLPLMFIAEARPSKLMKF